MIRRATIELTTTLAVVCAADGARFVVVGRWDDEVAPALVRYIEGRAEDVLWAGDAHRVRTFLDHGQSYAAIAAYFELVGSRWDDERLDVYVIQSGVQEDVTRNSDDMPRSRFLDQLLCAE